jgi:hypothetical protein
MSMPNDCEFDEVSLVERSMLAGDGFYRLISFFFLAGM